MERFFGTLSREDGMGRPDEFRRIYNHERPHEALGMDVPARRYAPSSRRRPSSLPSAVDFPEGSQVRRTDGRGVFSYKGQGHKLGKALADATVGILDGDVYCGRASLGALDKYAL